MEFLIVLVALWWASRIFKRKPASSYGPPMRSTELMNEILDTERMGQDAAVSQQALQRRRYELACASKAEIERGIARHGVAGLGLSLRDIRAAEEELRAAGVQDWQIRIR